MTEIIARRWTPEDEAYLVANWRTMTAAQIGKVLSFTRSAVCAKAARMELSEPKSRRPRRVTQAESQRPKCDTRQPFLPADTPALPTHREEICAIELHRERDRQFARMVLSEMLRLKKQADFHASTVRPNLHTVHSPSALGGAPQQAAG